MLTRPAIIAAQVVGVAAFVYRYLSFVDFTNDHFLHLAMAQQITMGAWPVRDFVERGLPLMSLISAAGQAAFGAGLRSELIVVSGAFAVAAAATVLCVHAASRSITLAVGLAVASVLLFPASYSYPKLLPYAMALVAAGAYAAEPTWKRAVIVGAIAGAGFLLRHDHGILLLAGAGALFLVSGVTWMGAVRSALVAAAAAVIVAAPFLIWVQAFEGLGVYFSDAVRFSQREAEKATWAQLPRFSLDATRPMFVKLAHGPVVHVRWTPGLPDAIIRRGEDRHSLTRLKLVGPLSWQYELQSWSSGALEALVRDPLVADTDGIDRSAFRLKDEPPFVDRLLVRLYGPDEGLQLRRNGVAALDYLAWLLPIAATLALIVQRERWPEVVRGTVAMAIVLLFAMDLTMLRDPLDTRVRDVIVPACVLLGFLMSLAWHAPRSRSVRLVGQAAMVVLLAVFVITCGAVGEVSQKLEEIDARHGVSGMWQRMHALHRKLAPPREHLGEVSPMYESFAGYVDQCTPAGSRILSLTFIPELFFYSQREFAGGQVTLTPGYFATDRHASRMLERLAHEDVPLVVMDSETAGEIEHGYPRIMAWVRARYEETTRFAVGPGKDFILLTAKNRPAVGSFGPARLPCFVPHAGSAA